MQQHLDVILGDEELGKAELFAQPCNLDDHVSTFCVINVQNLVDERATIETT